MARLCRCHLLSFYWQVIHWSARATWLAFREVLLLFLVFGSGVNRLQFLFRIEHSHVSPEQFDIDNRAFWDALVTGGSGECGPDQGSLSSMILVTPGAKILERTIPSSGATDSGRAQKVDRKASLCMISFACSASSTPSA